MFHLRRWHKNLLLSEAIAALIVISAYRNIIDNPPSRVFLGGFAGTIMLSPGLALLGWPVSPFYPVVCLLTAAIYTGVLFGFLTIAGWVMSRVRRAFPAAASRIDRSDLDRYLR